MHIMEDPATASWGLIISDRDFVKLKRGFSPIDMDDRWWLRFMTEKELSDEETTSRAKMVEALASGTTANGTIANDVTTDEELMDEELMDEGELMDEELVDEASLDLTQGGYMSIRRSWTNTEIYRLAVTPREGGANAKIEAITWQQDREGYLMTEEQAKIDSVILCRTHLDCDFGAAPAYDNMLFGELVNVFGMPSENNTN